MSPKARQERGAVSPHLELLFTAQAYKSSLLAWLSRSIIRRHPPE